MEQITKRLRAISLKDVTFDPEISAYINQILVDLTLELLKGSPQITAKQAIEKARLQLNCLCKAIKEDV